MIVATLSSMVGIFIYSIVCDFYNRYWVMPCMVPAFLIIGGFNYIFQIPVYLPWLLITNIITMFIFMLCTYEYAGDRPAKKCEWLFVVMVIAEIGIQFNSFYGDRIAYKSIQSHISTSKRAPTMHRGATPIAIPPATVFYKVNTDFGANVPHHNTLKIADDDSNDDHGDNRQIQAQYYRGKRIFVIPLEYKHVLQYHKYRVVPGYFTIDATDPRAHAHFVNSPIRYGSGMYLHHSVDRNIYRAHPEYRQIDGAGAQLEIDNHKHPYEVETEYKPSQIDTRPRFDQLRVAVEDANTGKVKFYKPKNAPKFVDENLTSTVADIMNQYYGHFKYGFWNYHGYGLSGVQKPTENGPEDGVTTVFNPHHTITYVTDYTSYSKKSTTDIGSSAINARTGKLTYYKSHSIMDSNAAEKNANSTMRKWHFWADNPVMYDIDGHATWVMSILDNNDNQRFWYYVDNDADTYDYDKSATATLDEFRAGLTSSGGTNSNTHAMKKSIKSGTIDRYAVSDNRAVFTLKGSNKVYSVKIGGHMKDVLIHPNDSVRFKIGVNGSHADTDLVDKTLE